MYDYINMDDFNEGLLAVQKGKKWGFVNRNGIAVIPFIYEHAMHFSEGWAPVQKGYRWGYIDKQGKTVRPFTYYFAYPFYNGVGCRHRWMQLPFYQ